jgi:hypothetical protein
MYHRRYYSPFPSVHGVSSLRKSARFSESTATTDLYVPFGAGVPEDGRKMIEIGTGASTPPMLYYIHEHDSPSSWHHPPPPSVLLKLPQHKIFAHVLTLLTVCYITCKHILIGFSLYENYRVIDF